VSPIVVRFARCDREPDRQAATIDHRMYLAGQTASRPAQFLRRRPSALFTRASVRWLAANSKDQILNDRGGIIQKFVSQGWPLRGGRLALTLGNRSPCFSRLANSQPVRWIVGFLPGGGGDTVTRIMGGWLSARIGQPR
jgi:hypothetical protein